MYVGIDLGTSSVKVMLVDGNQTIIGSAFSSLEVSRPHSGWSEQDPKDWIEATSAAMHELKSLHGGAFSKVVAIGLSGHMHGATLIDRAGEVIRPCMLWNDTRSHMQAARLDANPSFREISGNIVFPGFTAPKVDWVRENEPENFAKIFKVLLPKDYLRFWLTGETVSEMSDAAGTSWLDVGSRDWSETLLDACELGREHMPLLVEGSEESGKLKKELSDQWGLGGKVVVAGGAGDNAASAVGMGTVEAGSAFLSLGTSGVLFAANDAYLPNPDSAVHAFCHAVPGRWHQMGVILAATDSLNWFSKLVGISQGELTSALGNELNAPGNAVFLPYLGGERTPHNDASVRGILAGIDHGSDRAVVTQAILEGVSFAFRDCQEALLSAGTRIARATAIGGGAKSVYWLQLMATVLDIEIDVPQKGDFGAALGAARLGMMAAGAGDVSAICKAPSIEKTIKPELSLQSSFEEAYAKYKALYPAIRSL